jgi:4-carboxymuconolactone decarboxylase
MTERLRRLPPTALSAAQREVYDAITSGPRRGPHMTDPDGGLYGPFNAMLLSPPVGHALQGLGAAIRYRSALTDRIREMAVLAVAAHHDCAYERHAHEAVGRRGGLTEDELVRLRTPGARPELGDPAERAALDVVQTLLGTGDLDDDRYARARSALGDDGLFELSTLVGYYGMLALQLRLFRVEVPGATD